MKKVIILYIGEGKWDHLLIRSLARSLARSLTIRRGGGVCRKVLLWHCKKIKRRKNG